jgi:hypothetical protein
MALPKVVVRDREVVLLSGFERHKRDHETPRSMLVIRDEDKLKKSVLKDRDAVAFGYVAGRWIASA